MLRPFRFLAGLWFGAALLAFPVASALLYLMTDKIAVPGYAGGLLPPEEVAARLQNVADKAMEKCDE